MPLTPNSALYYPSIEFSDYRWLWTASLIWDRIYRIEPQDFTPDEPENVRALCEDGEIGIPLRPGDYAKDVAAEFTATIEAGKWHAAALDPTSVTEDYARIHHEKIDVQIREALISKGRAASHDGWLYVPTDFESLYMTFLATRMAEKNSLQPVTDMRAAWTALTYYSNDGTETECVLEDMELSLAALMVGNFVPKNITDISPKALLDFRKKYPDERRNFMRAIKAAATTISGCEDPQVVRDMIATFEEDVQRATRDLKRSMEVLGAESFVGFKGMTIPVATPVLAALMPLNLGQSIVLGGTGLILGAIAGVASRDEKAKRLSKQHEFSYLVHAERTFSDASDGLSVSRRLNRDLNEFIED